MDNIIVPTDEIQRNMQQDIFKNEQEGLYRSSHLKETEISGVDINAGFKRQRRKVAK